MCINELTCRHISIYLNVDIINCHVCAFSCGIYMYKVVACKKIHAYIVICTHTYIRTLCQYSCTPSPKCNISNANHIHVLAIHSFGYFEVRRIFLVVAGLPFFCKV